MIGSSSHGFQGQGNMTTSKAALVAMANNVSTITPLVGVPFNLKHSIFVAKVVNRSAYSCTTWVLDTSAIDQIICLVSLLTSITSLTQYVFELPNGESAQVTHMGSVRLSANLILENVLYVPSFSFNLLSISKLPQKLPYCLVFLSQFCFIQDLSLGRRLEKVKCNMDSTCCKD